MFTGFIGHLGYIAVLPDEHHSQRVACVNVFLFKRSLLKLCGMIRDASAMTKKVPSTAVRCLSVWREISRGEHNTGIPMDPLGPMGIPWEWE